MRFSARAASGSATKSNVARLRMSNVPGRIRTSDRRIRNPMLYPTELRAHRKNHRISRKLLTASPIPRDRHLSFAHLSFEFSIRSAGFEPATLGFEDRCSIQAELRTRGCDHIRENESEKEGAKGQSGKGSILIVPEGLPNSIPHSELQVPRFSSRLFPLSHCPSAPLPLPLFPTTLPPHGSRNRRSPQRRQKHPL